MKLQLLFVFLSVGLVYGQPDTEVYLFDIVKEGNNYILKNQENISNNIGYDSQPFFLNDSTLIYAGSLKGQTEIMRWSNNQRAQLNFPTAGGEYSPQQIPRTNDFSAVRLDTNGYQRLYRYPAKRREQSTELIQDAVVAYYTWVDENIIVAADIVNRKLHLVIHDIKNKKDTDLGIEVGRSFHKIPNTNLVSFIDKSKEQWFVKSIDPATKEIITIGALPSNAEDICWLPDGTLLLSKDENIFQFDKNVSWWIPFTSFTDQNLWNISRIASNPSGTKLALVSEVSPAIAVDRHIQPYNEKNLERFVAAFTNDVVMRNFFSDTLFSGKDQLRESYNRWFQKNDSVHVETLKRMVHSNVVIDEEVSTSNSGNKRHATIYEVKNGAIGSMTFVNNTTTEIDPTIVVDKQLEAYNSGDIDAFMSFYADSTFLYEYPTKKIMSSRDEMKTNYANLFKRAPDLNCKIQNRIVIGNKVIDKEELSSSGQIWYAIAIYEVNDDKITKVTFIQ